MKRNQDSIMPVSFKLVIVACIMATAMWTCKYPSGPFNGNTLPHTRLANIPANDTIAQYIQRNIIPELQLNWLGDDPDGYVIAFQYRWATKPGLNGNFPNVGWTTHLNLQNPRWSNMISAKSFAKDAAGNPVSLFNIYHYLATLGPNDSAIVRVIGESLFTQRTFAVPYKSGLVATDSIAGAPLLVLQTPTIGTFIFDSPDTSNYHRFDVRSVDNSNAPDPVGASVYFWTLRSPGSRVVMDQRPARNALAIREITNTWQGLHFAYHSLDENNQFGIEFHWSVDDTVHANSWSSWSPIPEANVTASHFKDSVGTAYPDSTGLHKFYVQARNRWGVRSPIVVDTFRVIVPPFDNPNNPKVTLIINADLNGRPQGAGGTYNGTPACGYPTINEVDSLYRNVMNVLGKNGKYSIYRVALNAGRFPPIDTLGKYICVLMLLEQKYYSFPRQVMPASPFQFDFFSYLDVGGKLIYSGTPLIQAMITNYFFPGGWARRVLHVYSSLTNVDFDFVGSKGALGYPDVTIDTSKISLDSLGAIRNIAMNIPDGFAQTISYFDSKSNGPFENLPLGIRFLSPNVTPPRRQTYSVVFFAYPLFYTPEASIVASLTKAFSDLNE